MSVAILLNLLRKRRVKMEGVSVSNVREGWTVCWKGDLPLASLLMVVMHSSCQRGSHGNAEGKKKSDGEGKKKERVKNLWKKEETYHFQTPHHPLSPQNSSIVRSLYFTPRGFKSLLYRRIYSSVRQKVR
jgi:hypothetical protein